MGFALKKEYLPQYKYKDYASWEGDWELIHGVPYSMSPSPSIEHQDINLAIAAQLKDLLKDCGECKAMMPVDWKVNDLTTVQPDASIICQKSGNKNFLDFAPTVIFEILSPSTEKKDKAVKFDLYESEGVKYYIIVSPKKKTVIIHELKKKRYSKVLQTKKGKFTFDLKDCDIEFDFSKIWT